MKMFIWKYIDQVSGAYHSGGGLLVVAEDESSARLAANSHSCVSLPDNEPADYVYDVTGPALVLTFPDAGCC